MSRSRGATSLTTRSPIEIDPPDASSSPATIRSAVDLPEPDGPTRIVNSPSAISRSSPSTARVPSGKTLETPSKVIWAISAPSRGGDVVAVPEPALLDGPLLRAEVHAHDPEALL